MTDQLPRHTHRILPIALAIAVLTHVPPAHAEEVQVGRYATVRAVPTKREVRVSGRMR